jgi:hypothetical protein
LSASVASLPSLSSAAFITNIAESDFRHIQGADRRDTSAQASPTGHEQRLHVSASRHLRVRWFKPLAQFAFGNTRAREKEGLFQIAGLAQGSIEKGITEIRPLGFVLAPKR